MKLSQSAISLKTRGLYLIASKAMEGAAFFEWQAGDFSNAILRQQKAIEWRGYSGPTRDGALMEFMLARMYKDYGQKEQWETHRALALKVARAAGDELLAQEIENYED